MKIKGNPNQIVQHRVRRAGKFRIEVLFQFDDNGEKEFDESVLSEGLVERIKKNFEVVSTNDTKQEEKSLKTELEAKLDEIIREKGKQLKIKSWHIMSIDTLKAKIEEIELNQEV